jgi:cytidine deaminase
MVIAGEQTIKEVCVVGGGDALVTPCGGCRQRIREFASDDIPIYICSPDGLRETLTLGQLLPLSFGPDNIIEKRDQE